MIAVYIGLGTNWGNRLQNIRRAVEKLREVMIVEKISSLYLTQPVEIKGGWFVNCVAMAKTEKQPLSVLKNLLQIEEEMGRIRGEREKRTIDLDLLFYGEKIIQEKELIVPHPRAHQRRFVLVPMVEINPQFRHPLFGKSMQQLLKELKDSFEVEKIGNYPGGKNTKSG